MRAMRGRARTCACMVAMQSLALDVNQVHEITCPDIMFRLWNITNVPIKMREAIAIEPIAYHCSAYETVDNWRLCQIACSYRYEVIARVLAIVLVECNRDSWT